MIAVLIVPPTKKRDTSHFCGVPDPIRQFGRFLYLFLLWLKMRDSNDCTTKWRFGKWWTIHQKRSFQLFKLSKLLTFTAQRNFKQPYRSLSVHYLNARANSHVRCCALTLESNRFNCMFLWSTKSWCAILSHENLLDCRLGRRVPLQRGLQQLPGSVTGDSRPERRRRDAQVLGQLLGRAQLLLVQGGEPWTLLFYFSHELFFEICSGHTGARCQKKTLQNKTPKWLK